MNDPSRPNTRQTATDSPQSAPQASGGPEPARDAADVADGRTAAPHTGLVVEPYRDHGRLRWVFRCWGTDTCDGLLSLDHDTRGSAESARDRHVAEEHAPGLTLRAVQSAAWANKIAKGFNTTDVALEFGLLTAEVGEAFTAWRRDPEHLSEELADVLLFLAGLAEMTGIDLQAEVEKKLAKNAARTYRRGTNGVLIKTDGATT